MSYKDHVSLIESASKGVLKEDSVDIGSIMAELTSKIDDLKAAIDGFDAISDDAEQAIAAMPTGLKNYTSVMKVMKSAEEALDAFEKDVVNSQLWDLSKLEK